jgi:hypothetical protein
MLQADFLFALHHNEEQPTLQLQDKLNDSLLSCTHSDDATHDHCHTHYHKTLINWAEIMAGTITQFT